MAKGRVSLLDGLMWRGNIEVCWSLAEIPAISVEIRLVSWFGYAFIEVHPISPCFFGNETPASQYLFGSF